MPAIAQTSTRVYGPVKIVKTTLTASDTLTYDQANNPTLFVENDTASPVSLVIDGADAASFAPGGIGAAIDLTTGFAMTIPVGETHAIELRNIQRYLKGVVTVTGGTGAKAYIVT